MFERAQRTIAMAMLSGYLLVVTAAPEIHRRCSDHAPGSRAFDIRVGAPWEPSELSGRTPEGDIAPSRPIVADGNLRHNEGECSVCQMLAQKYVTVVGPGTVLWAEVAHHAPVAEPRTAVGKPLLPWHIRAPPRIA